MRRHFSAGQEYEAARRRVWMIALAVAALWIPGCSRWANRQSVSLAGDTPTSQDAVAAVNQNADRAKSLLVKDLDITVGNVPTPLDGKLALEKPRRFRLTANSLAGREADLGSNDQEFWCYIRRAGVRPALIHCNYDQYANARRSIPFQPDWIVESIGLTPLLPHEDHAVRPGPRGTVEIVTSTTTPQGQPASKITVVQGKRGLIVERHLETGGRRVASAYLSQHQTDAVFGVVYPGTIAVNWPEAGMNLRVQLEDVVMNPQFDPGMAERLWRMPVEEVQAGAEDVDLGATAIPTTPRRAARAPAFPSPGREFEPATTAPEQEPPRRTSGMWMRGQ